MGERGGVYGEDEDMKQIRIGIALESASRCGACPRIITAEQIGGNSAWCGAFGRPSAWQQRNLTEKGNEDE